MSYSRSRAPDLLGFYRDHIRRPCEAASAGSFRETLAIKDDDQELDMPVTWDTAHVLNLAVTNVRDAKPTVETISDCLSRDAMSSITSCRIERDSHSCKWSMKPQGDLFPMPPNVLQVPRMNSG